MTMITILLTAVALATTPAAEDFWSHWGDGKGEVSSYRSITPRYGEPREGYTVLIFVTEDLSRRTRVKAESEATPAGDRVPVLKMNRVTRFTTGIYDYSLMTSTFAGVGDELGHGSFQPLKISFSAQDWCGQTFAMLVPERSDVKLTLHSYFESESDQQRTLELPAKHAFEDDLPIWIRELSGDVLEVGQRQTLEILPSAWISRSLHQEPKFDPGSIIKEAGESVTVMGTEFPTWRFTWQVGDRTETYWTERAYPHRILKWSSSDGASGVLKQSMRVPYWQLHAGQDIPYREKLELRR
jgi:hypothetical protein